MSFNSFSAPRINEQALQKELDALSPEERDLIYDEVHGQQTAFDERPELVQDALERLDEELEAIPSDETKDAFEMAQQRCPDYIRSMDFRIMFLRSTNFDAKLAADKMVLYWKRKVELFGPQKAFRKLSIADMDDEDTVALRRGGIRALPELDDAGRGLWYSRRAVWDNRDSHRMSMLRVLWFSGHVLLENEQVQRNGVVLLATNGLSSPGMLEAGDTKIVRFMFRDLGVLPLRVQALHQVLEMKAHRLVNDTTLFAMGPQVRARCRRHYIRTYDFADELEPYGIGKEVLPSNLGGTSDFDYEAWIEEEQQRHHHHLHHQEE